MLCVSTFRALLWRVGGPAGRFLHSLRESLKGKPGRLALLVSRVSPPAQARLTSTHRVFVLAADGNGRATQGRHVASHRFRDDHRPMLGPTATSKARSSPATRTPPLSAARRWSRGRDSECRRPDRTKPRRSSNRPRRRRRERDLLVEWFRSILTNCPCWTNRL